MSGGVVDVPERRRFELTVDGATAFVDYERDGDTIALNHTEVPKALSGQGVGSRLAKGVFDAMRATGQQPVVRCEFLAGWLAKHPDYRDAAKR